MRIGLLAAGVAALALGGCLDDFGPSGKKPNRVSGAAESASKAAPKAPQSLAMKVSPLQAGPAQDVGTATVSCDGGQPKTYPATYAFAADTMTMGLKADSGAMTLPPMKVAADGAIDGRESDSPGATTWTGKLGVAAGPDGTPKRTGSGEVRFALNFDVYGAKSAKNVSWCRVNWSIAA